MREFGERAMDGRGCGGREEQGASTTRTLILNGLNLQCASPPFPIPNG